jgi:hypothetical protein
MLERLFQQTPRPEPELETEYVHVTGTMDHTSTVYITL